MRSIQQHQGCRSNQNQRCDICLVVLSATIQRVNDLTEIIMDRLGGHPGKNKKQGYGHLKKYQL
jgi:hypothetical protein